MSNMDKFNEATAVVLSRLYETFPRRLSVRMEQLAVEHRDVALYGDTVMWLAKEDFVSYESRYGNSTFNGLTLTKKGLAALEITPDVLQDSTTLGEKLGKAAKEGSKDVLKGLVNTLIQSAVTGFIKSQE